MAYPYKDPSRSWKLNATSYNRYKAEQRRIARTPQGQANGSFGIYMVVLTIVLLVVFG